MLRLALFRPINSLPSLAQTRDDVPLLVSRDPFGSFKGRRMFNRKHYRHKTLLGLELISLFVRSRVSYSNGFIY